MFNSNGSDVILLHKTKEVREAQLQEEIQAGTEATEKMDLGDKVAAGAGVTFGLGLAFLGCLPFLLIFVVVILALVWCVQKLFEGIMG